MILGLGKVTATGTPSAIYVCRAKTRIDSLMIYSHAAAQTITTNLSKEGKGSEQIARHVLGLNESAEPIDLQEGDLSTFGNGDAIEVDATTDGVVGWVLVGEVLA